MEYSYRNMSNFEQFPISDFMHSNERPPIQGVKQAIFF